MTLNTPQRNPFTVTTPESLNAVDTNKLFVDVFTDFFKIRDEGHSMLNGPRGSGKSMMFRHLEPDCQCLQQECEISELSFFAVLISMKNLEVNPTDLRRLENAHFRVVLNEHLLTSYIASKFFTYVADLDLSPGSTSESDIAEFSSYIEDRLIRCGLDPDRKFQINATTPSEFFHQLGEVFDELHADVVQYAKRLSQPQSNRPFEGPLCGYLDFLFPVLRRFNSLWFMPEGPVYLLLDDADVLNETQTRVLNTWIGTRTSGHVSLKVSTQERYKTFAKVFGGVIESPHDYSEVNIADVYTTNRGRYLSRIRTIVKKRLELAGIMCEPDAFFPAYAIQEKKVEKIQQEILSGTHEVSGKGYRISDDVGRYARPIYMKSLAGTRKSSSKYMYAGFEELVHISSGLIRFFLEPAALMFSEQQAKHVGKISKIAHGIQHDEVYRMSVDLMTVEFDKIDDPNSYMDNGVIQDMDEEQEGPTPFLEQKRLLRNLLTVLGGTFRQKLLSDDAERRVFSVAFSDTPISEVVDIFELGVRHGYFQKSTIGNKDGTGRSVLYILTRRLAPFFRLDPSGFAGYLFVQSTRLYEAIQKPNSTLRRVRDKGTAAVLGESRQLIFPFDGDNDSVSRIT